MSGAFIRETVDGVRRKLNARILLGEIARRVPIICLSAGVLVFLWRLGCSFGLLPGSSFFGRGNAIYAFAALCAAASCVIAALARRKLLKREGAAIWLDDRLGARGIFSAALTCLSSDIASDFSDRVIDDAARSCRELLHAQEKLFPRRILIRRSLIALSALLFAAILLSVWNPRASELAQAAAAEGKKVSAVSPEREDSMAQKKKEKMTDAELARNIFPNNTRLASLAEEALKNGDQDALDYLMKKDGLKPEDLSSTSSTNEKAQQADGLTDQQSSAQSASDRREQTGGNPDSDQGKKGENRDKQNATKAPSGNDDGARSNDQNKQGKQGKEGDSTAPVSGEAKDNAEGNKAGETGQAGTGNNAGTGTAGDTTGLASGNGKKGSSKVIKFRKEGTPLEFVLPDKQAKATTMRAIPAAVRGSEAAIGSNNAPLEYESFVQFYFSNLSKETQQ